MTGAGDPDEIRDHTSDISVVLNALQAGAKTRDEVTEATGLSLHLVRETIMDLIRAGRLAIVGTDLVLLPLALEESTIHTEPKWPRGIPPHRLLRSLMINQSRGWEPEKVQQHRSVIKKVITDDFSDAFPGWWPEPWRNPQNWRVSISEEQYSWLTHKIVMLLHDDELKREDGGVGMALDSIDVLYAPASEELRKAGGDAPLPRRQISSEMQEVWDRIRELVSCHVVSHDELTYALSPGITPYDLLKVNLIELVEMPLVAGKWYTSRAEPGHVREKLGDLLYWHFWQRARAVQHAPTASGLDVIAEDGQAYRVWSHVPHPRRVSMIIGWQRRFMVGPSAPRPCRIIQLAVGRQDALELAELVAAEDFSCTVGWLTTNFDTKLLPSD